MTLSPTQRRALTKLAEGDFERLAAGWAPAHLPNDSIVYFQPGTILALEADRLVHVTRFNARITPRGRDWLRQTEDMEREMARVEAKRAAQ